MKLPIFVTGNRDKVAFVAEVLGVKLEHQKIELEEIQSADSRVVAGHKARQAYELIKQPVLIEDSYLTFMALGGLPGPLIKFFFELDNGLEILCRMLDGFDDRSAQAGAVYCYYDGNEMRMFDVSVKGTIASHPRGEGGYGWDKVLEPEACAGLTLAELPVAGGLEMYSASSGFQMLKDFLLSSEV